MAIVKYISSNGIEFDLLSFERIKLEKANFHKTEWKPETVQKQYGTTINRFTKDPLQFDCTFKLKGHPAYRQSKIQAFLFETEHDIAMQQPGTLYYNNQYISTYFTKHDTHPVDAGQVWTEVVGTFYSSFPFWIEEAVYSIDPEHFEPLPQKPDVKGYPSDRYNRYGYTYSYPYDGNTGRFSLETSFGADYRVVVYGPVADHFKMVVNGNNYQVNYPLLSSQKLIIDSRDYLCMNEKCYVENANGTKINVFDYRDPSSVLFERFIGNEAIVHVDKPYRFDITLFLERSEPL